jgi:TolA-binding protein
MEMAFQQAVAAKKGRTGILYLVLALSFFGCKPKLAQPEAETMPYPQLLKNLKTTAAQLEQTVPNQIDTVAVNHFGREVQIFARRFSKDAQAPLLFWQAVQAQQKAGQYPQAMALLDAFVKQFPNNEKRPDAIFLKAFIAETGLKDVDLAKKSYQGFIQAYPNHVLAQDAQLLLQQLQSKLSDEELILQFEAKEKEKK